MGTQWVTNKQEFPLFIYPSAVILNTGLREASWPNGLGPGGWGQDWTQLWQLPSMVL